MTRTEYLTQLELYLKKLPQADQIEAMDYFRELFDDAGVEGEENSSLVWELLRKQPTRFYQICSIKKSMKRPLKRITDKFCISPC